MTVVSAPRRVVVEERGQSSVELIGMLPFLLITALLVWQLLLAGYATTSAENAARTASRVQGLGGDGKKAAKDSLSFGLRDHVSTRFRDQRATVRVRIPIVAPGLSSRRLTVSRSAELPPG